MSWRVLTRLRSPHSFWALTLLMGWLWVAGCNGQATSEPKQSLTPVQTSPVQPTAIANLQDSAAKNSSFHVKGTVGAIVPLLEGTVYELQDASGKIWILTQQPAPKTGEDVVVKGTVRYKPISINGKEQGSIYLEQE
ncbi:MAG: hypothetical protein NW224_05950 [Leptolyngbyaceae cyanobacterium bins.302]|nr:hypothetical protein [Leptolyngbyaceae cyanobacterium bins.302]